MKSLIAPALILKIIDPNLPLRWKIDASSEELEAFLEQDHGSLENRKCSSHALRDYENRYAQI